MRLIDADALINWLGTEIDPEEWSVSQFNADWIYCFIDNAPTIDAVEVVRCKDCKYSMLWWKPTDKVIGECWIRKTNSEDEQFCLVEQCDFCSYGERREP